MCLGINGYKDDDVVLRSGERVIPSRRAFPRFHGELSLHCLNELILRIAING
jgi:hypothetical protein